MKRFAIVAVIVAGLALSSMALAAGTLSGTYETKVHSTALGGGLNGTWTIKFKRGTYTVSGPGNTKFHAKYSIAGTKVTFKARSSSNACHTAAIYKFKLNGKTLKFTKVRDSNPACVARQTILKGTFTKVG
jgi:hypothetical protein